MGARRGEGSPVHNYKRGNRSASQTWTLEIGHFKKDGRGAIWAIWLTSSRVFLLLLVVGKILYDP
ncbi:hypothetical protein H5410_020802 [Solanum commersonii]|uniref:Uncharacterized protein n=1 Tax=Solanum commersonii TaxID=4109 RepID=A0A9J5Z9H3_SOLCO|nr:hypothetical protein H5410_020802 [Solanum commersonii]